MGTQRVEVYKGKGRGGCFWLILASLFLICIVPILCVGAIAAGLASGAISEVDLKSASFSEPLGDADSAQIQIDSGVAQVNINALTDSNNLFEGDITYYGEIDFTAGGDIEKIIRLEQVNTSGNFFGNFNFFNINTGEDIQWNIGIAPDVPVALNIQSGIESSTFNLADLYITDLQTNLGVGDTNITLPEPQESYSVNINSGIGNVTVNLPHDVAVRITAQQGLGDITVPANLRRISGEDSDFGGSGVWESEGFANAERTITIEINGGVGDITVQ